ncbi:protein of unknown function (plasmid) [Shinella sp. WSC3-e]|nr:hypothetical protein SHINE37_80024 [Rhizobiaceae bacterium]CAK7261949.1 protein of unknown function [Shinella sp. WSC3-e]
MDDFGHGQTPQFYGMSSEQRFSVVVGSNLFGYPLIVIRLQSLATVATQPTATMIGTGRHPSPARAAKT